MEGRPDGTVPALQAQAIGASAQALRHRAIPRPESVIAASLAQKILHGWMQNRHQTLYPLVLNLRHMTPCDKLLIIEALALAVQAGEEAAAGRAQGWLQSVGGGEADALALTQARERPAAIAVLVGAVRGAGQGPAAYAAAVGAIGRRSLVNRRFLEYFASRLGIADEVARSMNRRYGA